MEVKVEGKVELSSAEMIWSGGVEVVEQVKVEVKMEVDVEWGGV